MYEGAEGNLPDQRSEAAARRLVETVTDLGQEDLVILLISGGGSSLLSLPAPGVSSQQKLEVIKQLARAGADITELNTVRSVQSEQHFWEISFAERQNHSFMLLDVLSKEILAN